MTELNYNRIISQDDLLKIGEKTKDKLITLASIEENKINSNILENDNRHLKVKEILNTGFYNNFPNEQKELMATHIMYDSEKVIKILLSVNLDYDIVNLLCKRITELKNNKDKKVNQNYINTILSIIDKICILINRVLKGKDDYIIINKLMYITTFEEILYRNLEYEKSKKL